LNEVTQNCYVQRLACWGIANLIRYDVQRTENVGVIAGSVFRVRRELQHLFAHLSGEPLQILIIWLATGWNDKAQNPAL
jgi:hypothetical protein